VIIMAAAVTIGIRAARADEPAPGSDGQAAFAADLYQRVSAGDGNVFFSPYSVRTALAMVDAGAGGATGDQINHALHLSPGEELSQLALKKPDADSPGSKVFQLEVVNALWGQAGYPFKPEFGKMLESDFAADFSTVDFAKDPEAVRAAVNHWADQSTHGKVTEVLPKGSVDKSTRLVLADAVYFKARWAEPFGKGATKPGKFHLKPDADADVPMMSASPESEGYLKQDGYEVVSKPYELGRAEFVMVVPDDPAGLPAVEKSLDTKSIAKWTTGLPKEMVRLKMPKFTTKWNRELTPACKAMGIVDAFDPARADFSKMADTSKGDPLSISGLYHSSFVSVDEEGTEAAAVTVAGMKAMAMRPRPEVIHDVVADRPFLFMVVDRETKTVLFMGRITDPR
jgi:serpin B